MPAFFKDPAFWTAVVTIVFVVLAAVWPDQKSTFDQLTPPVVALIVALFARSAALQIAAFKYGYKKDDKQGWVKQ